MTALSKEQILPTLIKAISEHTGYPEESVTDDMNLESDLGVDSIGTVEILSKVSEQYGINWEDLNEDQTAKLMDLKTVKEVSEFIKTIV